MATRMKTWNVHYTRFNPFSGVSREYTKKVEAATAQSAVNKANREFNKSNAMNPSRSCTAWSAELA